MATRKSAGASPTPPDPDQTPDVAPRTRRRRTVAAEPKPPTIQAGEAGAETASAGGADPGMGLASTRPDIHEDGSWIEADAVEVHQGAVGRVDATQLTVTQGAIGGAKGERIDVQMGAVGAALGGHVAVEQGFAGTVLAQEARVEQSVVRTLIARDVTFGRPSVVVFMLAQRVSGELRVLLDWRGALAFGAAFGVIAGLFGRGRKRS